MFKFLAWIFGWRCAVQPAQRETLLWVGDGMAPAGPHLIGSPVNVHGRTGRVVDASALTIVVEWDA